MKEVAAIIDINEKQTEVEEMPEMDESENGQLCPGTIPTLFSEKGSMHEAVICGTTAGVCSGIPLETWKKMLADDPGLGQDDE